MSATKKVKIYLPININLTFANTILKGHGKPTFLVTNTTFLVTIIRASFHFSIEVQLVFAFTLTLKTKPFPAFSGVAFFKSFTRFFFLQTDLT